MLRKFFRLLYRARSRPQRMRIYCWVLAIGFLFLLVLVTSQQPPTFTPLEGRHARETLSDDSIRLSEKILSQDYHAFKKTASREQPKSRGGREERYRMDVEETRDDEEEEEESADLSPDLAPPVVHFLWCGGADRKFEYRHYLAMRRASQVVKPDKVIFHHVGFPEPDPEGYYTWFNQTVSETANLVLRQLTVEDLLRDSHNRTDITGANTTKEDITLCPREVGVSRYLLILRLLQRLGGVYIPEDAILVDFPVHLRAASFVSGVVAHSLVQFSDGIIVARQGGFKPPSNAAQLLVTLASGRSTAQGMALQPCGTITHFDREEDGDCICVKVNKEIFPATIWDRETVSRQKAGLTESYFHTLARMAGYGAKSVQARSLGKSVVPRIGHYICWDCDIKFATYLSVLSSLYVAGLSKVYIHGVKKPGGKWWRHLQATGRVTHVHREFPEHGLDKATITQEVAIGIMRVAILIRYGGVYCDDRVIWTNSIPDHYFQYEAVASPGWRQLGAWPDSISHSTVLAKKNSEYLLQLRSLHTHNRKKRFWFVDQFLAYKIIERNPQVIQLDRHLQVSCLNHNCHPTWHEGYKVPLHENPPGASFSWQNETLSVLWDAFPSLELDTVKYTSGVIVDAARHVFNRAGVSLQELTAR